MLDVFLKFFEAMFERVIIIKFQNVFLPKKSKWLLKIKIQRLPMIEILAYMFVKEIINIIKGFIKTFIFLLFFSKLFEFKEQILFQSAGSITKKSNKFHLMIRFVQGVPYYYTPTLHRPNQKGYRAHQKLILKLILIEIDLT